MSQTLLLIFCLAGGLIAGAFIVWLTRPRAPASDRAADGIAQIHGRIDAMGSWLQTAHGQLQQSVNERLDAVSQNLGVSLQTTAKHTVENLQKLNERL